MHSHLQSSMNTTESEVVFQLLYELITTRFFIRSPLLTELVLLSWCWFSSSDYNSYLLTKALCLTTCRGDLFGLPWWLRW